MPCRLALALSLVLALACGGATADTAATGEHGPPVSIAADVPAPPDHTTLDVGPVRTTALGADLSVGSLLSAGTEGDPGTLLLHRAEIVDVRGTPEAVVLTVYARDDQAEAMLANRKPLIFHIEIPWGISPE